MRNNFDDLLIKAITAKKAITAIIAVIVVSG